MTDIGAAGFPTHNITDYQVGAAEDAEGNPMILLSFEANGEWVGYRLSPHNAGVIVNTITALVMGHEPPPDLGAN